MWKSCRWNPSNRGIREYFSGVRRAWASRRESPGRLACVGSSAIALLALQLLVAPAHAQVLYNTLTASGEQLRQINPDGSNNIPLQIGNLPQAANPALSLDGRFLSVRSSDPNRPFQFSSNVHVLDSVTGQLRQITSFQDETDPQTGATFNHSPRFTTFSPDGSLIAVSDFLNTQTNNQGGSSTAFTSIYRVSDGALLDGPAINGTASTLSTLGVGLSWSPATNAVAIPTNAPNGATAIFSGNTLFNVPLQQLTFPEVGTFGDITNVGNFVEEDSFPAFSPNGQALAYFRSRDVLTSAGAQPSLLSLRIASPAGDRSIFDFFPGFQPTGIGWSPDGTQLAISIGPQLSSGGVLYNLVDPAATEIFTINTDGSDLTPIAAAPAFSPAWSSLQQSGPTGDFNNDGVVDGDDFIAWQRGHSPTPGSSGDLATWENRFGSTTTTAATLGAARPVPEPHACGLIFIAVTIGLCKRRSVQGGRFESAAA